MSLFRMLVVKAAAAYQSDVVLPDWRGCRHLSHRAGERNVGTNRRGPQQVPHVAAPIEERCQ